MIKYYGYIEPEIKEQDYVLGSELSAPFEITKTDGDWTSYIPEGEPQKRGSLETNSCTNFAWLNMVETFLNFKYKDNRNFSERFLAIVSEQKRRGNDPHKVAEAIRKIGLVEEYKLPFNENMHWDTYFNPNPMTRYYLKDAKKWLNKYGFKHEYIFRKEIPLKHKQDLLLQALQRSPVGVSVYAWLEENDLYIKPEGEQDTHFTVLVGAKNGEYWIVYDSYPEDGSYLKKLAWDYDFGLAKGFYIGNPQLSCWKRLLNIFNL